MISDHVEDITLIRFNKNSHAFPQEIHLQGLCPYPYK